MNVQKDYKKIENKEPSGYFIMGQITMENGLSGQILEKEKAFRNRLMAHYMKAGG